MSRVGIFGGTFDPIHLGHLITAQSVKEIRELEKIIFIPAFISPHKSNAETSSPEDRLNMIKLAIKDIPFFDYSDMEIKMGGVSFTVDTLRELKKQYENLEFIIGYDNIINFNLWKMPDRIIELAELIVLRRRTNDRKIEKDKYYKAATFVKTPVIEISSSEVRDRIKEGKSVDFLIPSKVREYINKFNLYKE